MASAKTQARELANEVNKMFGGDVVRMGSDPNYVVKYHTTGLLPIDILLSGGIPEGRFVQIYGDWCIDPSSKVLTGDLRWVEAKTLRKGDSLIGFDEELNQGRGRSSAYRKATVERVARKTMPCYYVVTDKGETIVSANHMFVARHRTQRTREWREAKDVRPGDDLVWFGSPWDTERTYNHGYLAGIFDGEGWLDSGRVCYGQLPGAVHDYTNDAIKELGFDLTTFVQSNGVVKTAIAGGRYETLKFLGEVRPLRLLEKASAVWEGYSMVSRGPHAQAGSSSTKVISVEYVGEREVVAFQTSTGTFVSDGFMSHNSTLKSYIGLRAIAARQKSGGTAALIDTERAFDPEWAESIGVNVDELVIWPDRLDRKVHTGEEAMDVAQVLVANGVDLIVFDSIAAALPQAESDKRLHKESVQPARLAQLMSTALRRLTSTNAATSIIWINQTRVNIGITFGSNEAVSGGKAIPYYMSYMISVRKTGRISKDIKFYDGDKWVGGKSAIGQKFKAELTKSKLSQPMKQIWFDFNMEQGQIDLPAFLVAQALEAGIVTQKGNTWMFGEVKAVGKEKFRTAVGQNEKTMLALENEIRDHHGLPLLPTAAPKKTTPRKKNSLGSRGRGNLKGLKRKR